MDTINKIGITTEEYKVYKSMLKTPLDNISTLASELGVTRVTVYKILESLLAKGLIKESASSKNKVKYLAESPDILMNFIEKYKEESNSQFDQLKKQIPILKALAGDSKNLDESDFIVLRGTNTLEELDALILAEDKQLGGFTYEYHIDACFKFDKEYNLENNSYLDVVLQCGDRVVFPGAKKSIETAKNLIEKNPFLKNKWEPRWIDPKKFKMKVNFYCFGDKVAFSLGSYKQQDFLAYVIRNKEISDSMRSLSEFIWENANTI